LFVLYFYAFYKLFGSDIKEKNENPNLKSDWEIR